jgi:uncharacterized protein (TIGR03382 family)
MVTLLAWLWLAPAPAQAFVRETVEDDPDTPLFWANRQVVMYAATESSDDLEAVEIENSLIDAFGAWQMDGCTDLYLEYGGPARGTETNFVSDVRDGENRLVWREVEWPGDPEALAITTLIYRTATGEILDGDIDVNATTFSWTSTLDPEPVNDAQNTLTHEVGHLIGFAHAPDTGPGEISKRDLAPDDVQGLCFVYPAGAPTPSGRSVGAGFVGTCSAGGSSPIPWVVLALALLWRQRERRTA